MLQITENEGKVLLTLFKEFNINHNAHTLSKCLNITRVAALYILRNIEKKGIIFKKRFGKGIFYKLNLDDALAVSILKTLLMVEAREKASRWIWEFHLVYPLTDVVIIFGSVINDYHKAHDIDLVLVFKEKFWDSVHKYIENQNKILLKPVHTVQQLPADFKKNVKKPDPVLLNALKRGYILYGYEDVISAVNLAQKAHGLFYVPEPESR